MTLEKAIGLIVSQAEQIYDLKLREKEQEESLQRYNDMIQIQEVEIEQLKKENKRLNDDIELLQPITEL
jgi:septal ring factor EnvC (AmiA/AmiB activator)